MMAARPQNIGIKAIEIYFPSQCVDQTELEKFDGVSAGKYTIGLGQTKMSFCDDREDIYSIALTTLSSLFAKYSIDPNNVGRLEVGTETMLDKSKSVKSVLMQLFEKSGNFNVEGIDTVNACYGGTNAVFNSVNWVESSAWDGRDAVVVAGDIALYAKGAARPTGGAGCVAMLIGPNAPLAFEPGLRGSYITHAYDFYKPDFTSEYPVVDGHFSLRCYTEAVDACYKAYNAREKTIKRRSNDSLTNGHTNGYTNGHTNGHTNGYTNGHTNGATNGRTSPSDLIDKPALDRFDYMAFHAPTCKLVSKSYARLLYNDYLTNPSLPIFADVPAELRDLDYQASLSDRTLEKTFMNLTKKRFAERVNPAIEVATQCGNMYCGSVYGGIVSLLSFVSADALAGKRIGVFSYGSGLASSLFSMKVVGDISELALRLNLEKRLNARRVVSPDEYEIACAKRHEAHMKKDFRPTGDISQLRPGTYYLDHVDDKFRRQYKVAQG